MCAYLAPSHSNRTQILVRICKELIQAGEFEEAVNVANKIINQNAKQEALFDVVKAFAKVNFERAVEIVMTFPEKFNRMSALSTISKQAIKAGKIEEVRSAFYKKVPIEDMDELFEEFSEILVNSGKFSEAIFLAQGIQDINVKNSSLRKIFDSSKNVYDFVSATNAAMEMKMDQEDLIKNISDMIRKDGKKQEKMIQAMLPLINLKKYELVHCLLKVMPNECTETFLQKLPAQIKEEFMDFDEKEINQNDPWICSGWGNVTNESNGIEEF